MEKNDTLAYPAQALANKVFPVPGGPVSRAPLGILAPSLLNFSGCFKNSTNSDIYFLGVAIPATSLNLTLTVFLIFFYLP